MYILKKSYIIFIVTILFNLFFCKYIYAEVKNEEYSYNKVIFKENNLEVASKSVSDPTISSKAAIVIDRKTGLILYEKNSNEIRKMASTTKIMTAIVVIENTPNLYETVTVSKKAASIGGSVLGLRVNDKITINDLLYGLMLKSGNDTAVSYWQENIIDGNLSGMNNITKLFKNPLPFFSKYDIIYKNNRGHKIQKVM